MTQPTQESRERDWTAMHLGIGFFMSDMVRNVLPMADTKVRQMAVRNVLNLIIAGCTSEHDWRDAIDTLGELLRAHPDAHLESGTWYNGSPSILCLAAAQQAAVVSMQRLYPTLHSEDEIRGHSFKLFKYVLRAHAKSHANPEDLNWLELALSLPPAK
jgi:hypothetical protein